MFYFISTVVYLRWVERMSETFNVTISQLYDPRTLSSAAGLYLTTFYEQLSHENTMCDNVASLFILTINGHKLALAVLL